MSIVVPSPLIEAFRVYVLSIKVRKRDLFAKLLKDWKSAFSRMFETAAVAPLACLSKYMITRTVSLVALLAVPAGRHIRKRQFMLLKVHFRPIRVTSVVPCGILLIESIAIVPPVAIVASSTSMSWNFSSPPLANLPKNPAVRVNPGTILGRRLSVANDVRRANADPCRPHFRPPRRCALKALKDLNLWCICPLILCLLFG